MDPSSPLTGSVSSTNPGYGTLLDFGAPGSPSCPPDLIRLGAFLYRAARGTIFMLIRRATIVEAMLRSADPLGYIPYVQAFGWVYCSPDISRDQLPDLSPQEYASFFPDVRDRQLSNTSSEMRIPPRIENFDVNQRRGGDLGFKQGQI